MIKSYMEIMSQYHFLAIIPMVTFFICFIAIIIYAFRYSQDKIDRVKQLPLDTVEEDTDESSR